MTGVDLPTYMVEELRRIVKNAFKPIHEKLDQIAQSQQRSAQNFPQSIRRPRRGLMKEEKSCEEDFENAYRQFYGSKKRQGGARDRADIKLKNIPSIQKKYDHKSYLGGEWDNWIYEENQPLPTQQLEDTVTLNQTSHRLNPKEMKVEVEVVVDIKDEACLNQKELVEVFDREVDVKDDDVGEVDVKDDDVEPKMLKLEDPCEDMLEICDPIALDAKKTLTQARGVEEERQEKIFHWSCHIKDKYEGEVFCDEAPMQATYKWLEQPWLFGREVKHGDIFNKNSFMFKVQEKSELEPKKKNDAQGRKAMVQQSFLARNEDLVFDPGI